MHNIIAYKRRLLVALLLLVTLLAKSQQNQVNTKYLSITQAMKFTPGNQAYGKYLRTDAQGNIFLDVLGKDTVHLEGFFYGKSTTGAPDSLLLFKALHNHVWAGPATGSDSGKPSYRALVLADLPAGIADANSWHRSGDASTSADFIGPTGLTPLRFRVGGLDAGFINPLTYGTAFGYNTTAFTATATNTTAFGTAALQQISLGSFNTAIGRSAGQNVTTGSSNTLLGTLSGGNLATGHRNIHIGYGAGSLSGNVTNSIALGYATYAVNNQLAIYDSIYFWKSIGLSRNGTTAGYVLTDTSGNGDLVLKPAAGGSSGIYTPTVTIVSNIDSVFITPFIYTRLGDVIFGSGEITVDPYTPGATLTSILFSLPTASNFVSGENCNGSGTLMINTSIASNAYVTADIATKQALFSFGANYDGKIKFKVFFQYSIL